MAASRAEAGEARPARRRACSRRPATAPATAISALIDDTALQATVASMNASVASGAGVPAPAGSFISAGAQPAASSASAATAVPAPRRTLFLSDLLSGAANLLVDVGAIDGIAVTGQCARPRRDRVVVAPELEQHVPVVILDDGVGLHLIGCAAQIVLGQIKLVRLEVRPAEAVEVRPVVRIDLQRLLQQRHRFVEPLAALGEHVTKIIERGSVITVARQQLLERGLGVGELLLLVVDRPELEHDGIVGWKLRLRILE